MNIFLVTFLLEWKKTTNWLQGFFSFKIKILLIHTLRIETTQLDFRTKLRTKRQFNKQLLPPWIFWFVSKKRRRRRRRKKKRSLINSYKIMVFTERHWFINVFDWNRAHTRRTLWTLDYFFKEKKLCQILWCVS